MVTTEQGNEGINRIEQEGGMGKREGAMHPVPRYESG